MASLLRVVPLGGLGRVGGNIMVYETDDDLIVVDCGIMFPGDDELGVDIVLPDVRYIERNARKLRGYVLTHTHEDHVGALPYVLEALPAPVYGTAYSLAQLRMKLGEHPHLDPKLVQIHDNEYFDVGGFRILPIPVTHSIVGAVALALETPIGRVLHTGDFRIDRSPIDGRLTDEEGLRALGDKGVTLMLSDSTNSEREGHSWSESEVRDALTQVIATAEQRVMVTTFSSNLHRIQAVIDASTRADRTVIPVGRSMAQAVQLGLENGFLKAPRGSLADPSHFDDLARSQVTLLVSGSQGEPRGSFSRIAEGTHGLVAIDPGDTVVMSSRRIPGNELRVGKAINALYRRGAIVVDDRSAKVHTSGHAFQDEQRQMLEWVRPDWFIPIHGEYRHMVHHARTAQGCGVGRDRIFVTEDGKPVVFEKVGDIVRAARGQEVEAGPVYVADGTVGLVDEVVIRDRRLLADHGIVFCVVVLDQNDEVVAGPDIGTRGLFHIDENPQLIEEMCLVVAEALDRVTEPPEDLDGWGRIVRGALKRFFRRDRFARPLLVPMVLRAD
ncbi:MAG: ribonuclease J [Myxococcota bacterium]